MKFLEKKKSGADSDVDVAVFTAGKEELKVMVEILNDARLRTPRTIDTNPFRNRIKNIVDGLAEGLKELGWEKEKHNYKL